MADHHQAIADRDKLIFDKYNSPEFSTFTKSQFDKDRLIEEFNRIQNQKEQRRLHRKEEDNMYRKASLLRDMDETNAYIRGQNEREIRKRTDLRDAERKLRGDVGKVNQFTSPKIAEILDIYKRQTVKNVLAKKYKVELQQQILDKRLREENERLYLDDKQMAINGSLIQKVNPKLFEAKFGSVEKLKADQKYLAEECRRLNDVKHNKFFLQNTLRSQRFKD
uniref:Uncharacterized protein n=1 Tax=Strombidium rassoulzadegani TaxID=1082188 RepID=A0A7S3CQ52_9SPIT|mmetsp:Transcript_3184/g.5314  ORF Transcript_3184/g.5314 Transcript_3184/m.5314 type:complete len:222 (+) Transcript_3184:2-667(+)